MAWKNNGETELCRIKCVPCVFKCNGWTARQLTIREHATGLNHSPTLLWPWMPLSHNAVILPQGRKPEERNKKNVSEKAVHAGAEPRVNFTGRINNSACHRGAWDMWPTCLCKQRLTALACLFHLSIGVLDSLFTLFQCWKSLVTADTWNRNSLTQRLWPQRWRICAINKSENLSSHNDTNWSCTHFIFTHSNYSSNPQRSTDTEAVKLYSSARETWHTQWVSSRPELCLRVWALWSLYWILFLLSPYPPAWPTAQSRMSYNKIPFTNIYIYIYILPSWAPQQIST